MSASLCSDTLDAVAAYLKAWKDEFDSDSAHDQIHRKFLSEVIERLRHDLKQ